MKWENVLLNYIIISTVFVDRNDYDVILTALDKLK